MAKSENTTTAVGPLDGKQLTKGEAMNLDLSERTLHLAKIEKHHASVLLEKATIDFEQATVRHKRLVDHLAATHKVD